jgi:hypothetical protein
VQKSAHRLERLGAVLDPPALLRRGTLVEQKGEFLACRAAGLAREFARPEIERIRPRRDDAEIGRLDCRGSRRRFACARVDDRQRETLLLKHGQGALQLSRRHPLDRDILFMARLRPFRQGH